MSYFDLNGRKHSRSHVDVACFAARPAFAFRFAFGNDVFVRHGSRKNIVRVFVRTSVRVCVRNRFTPLHPCFLPRQVVR